jgi:hypothetical protein
LYISCKKLFMYPPQNLSESMGVLPQCIGEKPQVVRDSHHNSSIQLA